MSICKLLLNDCFKKSLTSLYVSPTAIATDSRNNTMYVCDSMNCRIVVYSDDRQPLYSIGQKGTLLMNNYFYHFDCSQNIYFKITSKKINMIFDFGIKVVKHNLGNHLEQFYQVTNIPS